MNQFSTVRYVYDDIEEALAMSANFLALFLEEGIYENHEIVMLRNGRFMINFKVSA